ncbi:MAG TPA: glutamine amidotransferase, partial [Xanthobacteraceae bacterium]
MSDRLIQPSPVVKRPVLIVLHQEISTPGRVGHALTRLGVPMDIRRPRFGDPLPETLDRHAGAVVFGGPMSANDEDDFVKREIDWMSVPLAEQRPLL